MLVGDGADDTVITARTVDADVRGESPPPISRRFCPMSPPPVRATPSGAAGSASTPAGSGSGEFDIIAAITAGYTQPAGTLIGPGDDAAVVTAPDGRVVVSTDMLVDGVHFRSDWAEPEQIGRRAALAAMADIAAMGASPTALVVAVGAPIGTPLATFIGLSRGLHEAAASVGAGVVGGDMTKADVLAITVTVLGDLGGRRPLRRDGARPGDLVAVAGRLGWASAGLTVLSRGFRSPVSLVNAYRVPEPPLAAGPAASDLGATAMIDVSDGLLADAGHIARASGMVIDIRTASLVIHPRLAEVASALGRDPLVWVLSGGDDHALLATFPEGTDLPAPWTAIGRVGAAADGPGVTVDSAPYDGPVGWDHFR
jgi:thiamine-monophosphate kinase